MKREAHVFCSRPEDSPQQAFERHNQAEKAFEAMRDALIRITRGLTNDQKQRGETVRGIAREALALADKVSR